MIGPDIRSVFGTRMLLADGSTGTALEALAPGRSATFLPLEDPALVEDLHRALFRGRFSDVVETATFSANERIFPSWARKGGPGVHRVAAGSRRARGAKKAHTGEEGRYGSRVPWGPGRIPEPGGVDLRGPFGPPICPRCWGFWKEGPDLIFIETCQDPLQIKAAVEPYTTRRRSWGARSPLGFPRPWTLRTDVDGTSVVALSAIIAPYRPMPWGSTVPGFPSSWPTPSRRWRRSRPCP
jgi:5-methyltetrahydrofolate--homocysteine methyltransferase